MAALSMLTRSQIPESIASLLDFWSGGVSSGLSLQQVVRLSVDEAPVKLRRSLITMIRQVELGLSWQEVFDSWEAKRFCPEVQTIGVVVEISETVGTDLGAALKRVSRVIRQNQKIKRELMAMTIQSRLTCFLLMAIPPVLVLLINTLSPGFLAPLWNTPQGLGALSIAGILQLLGTVMVIRLTRVKWL